MKPIVFCLVPVFSLSGCDSGAGQSSGENSARGMGNFQVLGRDAGAGQTIIHVEVPRGTTESEMDSYCYLMRSSEGGANEVIVKFYNGGRGAKNLLRSCRGSSDVQSDSGGFLAK